jgi:2-dehydropantoate 2-reductase
MPTKSHQRAPKRILVIGAGVIGAIYGWALSQAGHKVTHLVRPGKAAALADGLLVDMYDVRQKPHNRTVTRYPLRAIESLANAGPYDLAIVPTKHYQLEVALRQIVPFTGDADYLLLTQNWNGAAAIDAILPPTHYILGDAKAGGTFKGQTLVATLATLDVGPVNSAPNACLARIVDLFESVGIETTVHDQMLPYL